MPTEFASLVEFGSFWTTRFHDETESILNVFTMGLGGPNTSTQLRQFLSTNCITYTKIYIFAFGKSGPDESQTRDELEAIEALSTCAGRIETYFLNDYLPINYQLVRPSKETAINMLELQSDHVTYDYYSGTVPTFMFEDTNGRRLREFQTAQISKIFKVIKHWNDYFLNVKNGKLVIDNNVFIVTNYPGASFKTNLNFEYMPWIPKILQSYKDTGRVFQLKKPRIGTLEVPSLHPFFSETAVYKWPAIFIYWILVYNSFVPPDLTEPLKAATINSDISENDQRKRLLFYYTCRKNNPGLNELPNFETSTCPPVVAAAPEPAPAPAPLPAPAPAPASAGAASGPAREAGITSEPLGGAGVGGRRRKARRSRRHQKMSRRRRN